VKTSGLGRFSLGQPFPARPHAVCVNLPTFADVVGYEEKNPATLAAMPTGYPRFVRHQMIQAMIDHLSDQSGQDRQGYLFARHEDCLDVINRYEITPNLIREEEDWTFLQLPDSSPENTRVASYFQNTGCGISSRLAEDYLWEHGLLENREVLSEQNQAEQTIKETITQAHGPSVSSKDLLLASSGANAFHSLFKTAVEQAKDKGKTIWIRWGWLYLDTIEVMNLYGGEGDVIELNEIGDSSQLQSLFDIYEEKIAGVVTEFPTNPLLQAGDLQLVRKLCDQADALLVIDPTMVSPKNAKITEIADVVVNSLTKYAGWEGDVMMGSLAFPTSSTKGQNLLEKTRQLICPPYSRDLVRMTEQIPFYNHFIEQVNANTMEVANFLERHPRVTQVHWAYQENHRKNYEKVAGQNCPGCNLSFELEEDFEPFYNRLEMLKSPSFGTEFSNCCPYVYLAHYSMIQSESGRSKLAGAGISPNLLRLSVGLEPVDQIIGTLKKALQ
jgi:cystathionine gamma-synthase